MNSWALEEVKTADLGDSRLNKRMAIVLEQLGQHPQLSIPTACGGWTETVGAYRFFDNDKATFESVLSAHREATIERMKSSPVTLLAQDTTEDDQHICLGSTGLGTIKKMKKIQRRLHPTLAFTPQKICLGVVKAAYWTRDKPSPRKERHNKGIDEKESRHWIESYQTSCELQALIPETLIVNLADREGDIYEWFSEYESYEASIRAQWIVRATQNRCLLTNSVNDVKLWDVLKSSKVIGNLSVEVKPRLNRIARLAKVTIRSTTVTLKPPSRTGYHLPEITINVILACEESPPTGVKALEWVLLTSLPVSTFDQATTVVAWYAVRWCIEVYFYVLKSGCQIKQLHFETEERLLPCLALYMIITWRVLFTLMLGRACPEMDCEILFDHQEWQAAYIVIKRSLPPLTPPSLGEMIVMVAKLGGYLGRKHDSPPGPKAMWVGFQRLREYVTALKAREFVEKTCV